MIGHQTGKTITSTNPAQKTGTIERMKPSVSHSRSIPNVMQPGRSNENISIITERRTKGLSLRGNCLHMPPTTR